MTLVYKNVLFWRKTSRDGISDIQPCLLITIRRSFVDLRINLWKKRKYLTELCPYLKVCIELSHIRSTFSYTSVFLRFYS